MREATLGGISTLDGSQPRARAAPRRPASPRGPAGGFRSRFRRIRSRFALIVGSAGFSAIMIGIVLNATMMQKGHHPAPLFAPAAPVRAAAPVVMPAPLEAPVAAPAALPPVPAPALVEPPRPQSAPTHPAAATVPVHHAGKAADGIARLLQAGSPPAAKPAAKAAPGPAKAHPTKTAQTAATKAHPKTTTD